jgi:16S rRNA (uracil1498-N3)-methyltransferase
MLKRMKKNQQQQNEKHLFALHHGDLSDEIGNNSIGKELIITDSDLAHRIISILRFSIGQLFILFDKDMNAIVSLSDFQKNKLIKVILKEKNKNLFIKPEIEFVLPLLKKESLETALYSLTEIGVTTIHLVYTQKSQQKWFQKDLERWQKIIIAAAEQSKNFRYPQLNSPLSLSSVCEQLSSGNKKIFFDPSGSLISMIVPELKSNKEIILAIGPEGDLTIEEKDLMKRSGFIFSSLTQTILRACQAAAISAGIIRSYIR